MLTNVNSRLWTLITRVSSMEKYTAHEERSDRMDVTNHKPSRHFRAYNLYLEKVRLLCIGAGVGHSRCYGYSYTHIIVKDPHAPLWGSLSKWLASALELIILRGRQTKSIIAQTHVCLIYESTIRRTQTCETVQMLRKRFGCDGESSIAKTYQSSICIICVYLE